MMLLMRKTYLLNSIFVYGTLRPGLSNFHLLLPYIKKIERAFTRGSIYHLPYGYPAMIDGEDIVHGDYIEVKKIHQVLKLLDELETYYGPNNPQNEYERRKTKVINKFGKEKDAYIYIWAKPKELRQYGEIVPGGDWKKYIRDKKSRR